MGEPVYGGFWRRCGSNLVDALVLLPLFMTQTFQDAHGSLQAGMISRLFTTLVPPVFTIFCIGRWGKTPGKAVMGMEVRLLDLTPVSWQSAFLRHAVEVLLAIGGLYFIFQAFGQISPNEYGQLNRYQRSLLLVKSFSVGYWVLIGFAALWFWSEVIVLLFNEKKRALHDFIAGTVVVVSESLK